MPVSPTNQQDWVGSTVGENRYEIKSRLGSGAMGVVYLAWDRRLKADVVVKVPRATPMDDPEYVQRFRAEIRSLVRLSHPHIVKIHDVGEEAGIPFAVMQYLSGGNLKTRTCDARGKARQMPADSLFEWLPEVAKALDFMHGQQSLHRDVKPANILFDQHANAFLGDFGLTKFLAQETEGAGAALAGMTGAGFLVGTAEYVAPEVVLGTDAEGRSDQYSLAISVYEVLAGRIPFEGKTASAVLVMQTQTRPPALGELRPDLPAELVAAVHKGLAKRPAQRFEDCSEFSDAVLSAIPSTPRVRRTRTAAPKGKGDKLALPCPACQRVLPVKREYAGKLAKCARCSTFLHVADDLSRLRRVTFTGSSGATPGKGGGSTSRQARAGRTEISQSAAYEAIVLDDRLFGLRLSKRTALILTGITALAIVGATLFAGVGYMNARLAEQQQKMKNEIMGATSSHEDDGQAPVVPAPAGPAEPLVVWTSADKTAWVEKCAELFRQTPEGGRQTIRVEARPSGDSGAALASETTTRIWLPASRAFEAEVREKRAKLGRPGELTDGVSVARSAVVLIFQADRQEALAARFGPIGLKTVTEALREPEGWKKLADRSDWGDFRFAWPDPARSDLGRLALVWGALELQGGKQTLAAADVQTLEFETWSFWMQKKLSGPPQTADELARRMRPASGPGLDGILASEAEAFALLSQPGSTSQIRVIYPNPILLCDHPCFILEGTSEQKELNAAAVAFRTLLLSAAAQNTLSQFGLRPAGEGDVDWDAYSHSGIQSQLTAEANIPAEVFQTLSRIASQPP